ncbi:MAG: hypothetical protein KA116_05500 [Proteobacteria bacterium]|jgi:hypothetical protein|nr:hypothetical protein [Pseudomonadota bacterium]
MDDGNLQELLDKLVKDLELAIDDRFGKNSVLGALFSEWKKIPSDQFKQLALDLSLFAGSFGDWVLAFEILQKLQTVSPVSGPMKLWELRCLVELNRSSEALAMARAHHWSLEEQIHVNYLSGLAYEALGLRLEAAQRFDAVYRKNPHYSDVALRLVRE